MNEALLILEAVICAAIVVLAWRVDRERLFGLIALFLILISITGGKVVTVFGHQTNTGNIFYAAAYLATYFIIERYGRRDGFRSIRIGVITVLGFSLLARISVWLAGSGTTSAFDDALMLALAPSWHVALASLIAFTCSQSLNVSLYIAIKEHMPQIGTWMRANTANLFAQILDSLLFFSIAFWGMVPPDNLLDAALTGIVIKVVFMCFAAPLLTFNGIEERSSDGFISLTWK